MKSEVSENFRELLLKNENQINIKPAISGVITSTIISGVSSVSSLGIGVSLNPDSYTSRMPQPTRASEKKIQQNEKAVGCPESG